MTLASVYLFPNDRIGQFRDRLGALKDATQASKRGLWG